MVVSESQELKKTYSFTLLPSERQMLKELAESSLSVCQIHSFFQA